MESQPFQIYSLGNALKAMREHKDMPQQFIAASCGIDQGNLSRIENDARPPTTLEMFKYAHAMKIDPVAIPFFWGKIFKEVRATNASNYGKILSNW